MQASKPNAPVVTRVSVPYATKWGQHVRLVLGNEPVARASPLDCQHVGEELVWSAELAWPKASHYTYKYVVVNEAGSVEDEETRPRTVQVPGTLRPGATLQLMDEWQVPFCCRRIPQFGGCFYFDAQQTYQQ